MANARELAVRCLLDTWERNGFSQLVLDAALRRAALSPADGAFAAALFYGVIERKITLDRVLSLYVRPCAEPMTPAVREILRLGLYQLIFLPSVPAFSAVDESVRLCESFGAGRAKGFVNGVLRTFVRANGAIQMPEHRLEALSVLHSVPEELLRLWNTVYGRGAAETILAGCATPPPCFARVNTGRITRNALMERLAAEGVGAEETPLPAAVRLIRPGKLTELPSFQEGLLHIQDLSAQAAVDLLDLRPGLRVLDVCAAPGGKSFTIAEEMADSGEVVACDLSPGRVSLIREGAERLGLTSVTARVQDGTRFDPGLGLFDRVLCDAPCSGYGVLRRKPEIRYRSPESAAGLPAVQGNLLATAARYCGPDGLLLYATCTLNPRENEHVVKGFLKGRPDFTAGPPVTRFPEAGGGDGFFTCVLRRKKVTP